MSHEVETMAWAKEVPWHGLGKEIPSDLTPQQILEAAELDWTVEKRPMYFRNQDGKEISVGRPALVRSTDEKVLSVVSGDWNPVQNIEAFEFFHEFVMEGKMDMNTAGSLRGGKMVWALAEVKESFEILGGDRVESYLLFSNPHEYGKSIDIRFTPIRVVCANTLALSLNNATDLSVKLNHRKAFDAEFVKETMGIARTKLHEYKEMAEFLSSKRYRPAQLVEFLQQIFPSVATQKTDEDSSLSRPGTIVYDTLETQPGAEFGRGSWWQVFNSATYASNHLLGRRTDTRIDSLWYGANKIKNIKALNLAVEMAGQSSGM